MADNTSKRPAFRTVALKAGRVMWITLLIGLAAMLILIGGLWLVSPGKSVPFTDKDGKPVAGSISEKIWVNINGVEQGMFIKGTDEHNPVLLFLHGGTGMPETVLTRSYPTELENYFTVCWWERRGAGLSYSADIPPETMTVEQMIADTLAVTNYLRSRFHQDKIYLMGHSGGSFIGIQAAARAPELYLAYIGMGQMAYQLKSENVAYDTMLALAKATNNEDLAKKLKDAPPTMTAPLPTAYMALRDEAMHSLGVGTTHEMKSVVTGIFIPSWLNSEYTLSEKLDIWRGKGFSDRLLWDKMIATDLTRQVTQLDLPVYFLHGKFDYTVAYPVTKAYFEQLKAPVKGFYTFEQSAHSPLFEEPAKALNILREDVLTGTTTLADVR